MSIPRLTLASWLLAITIPFACNHASGQSEVVVIDTFDDPVAQLTGVIPGTPGGQQEGTGPGIYGGGMRTLTCIISDQTASTSLSVAGGKATGALSSTQLQKIGQVIMSYGGFGSLDVDPSGTVVLELASQYQGPAAIDAMMAPLNIRLDLYNAGFKSKTWYAIGSTTSEGITFDLSSPAFGAADFDFSAVERISLTFSAAYFSAPGTSYSFDMDSFSISTVPQGPGISVRPASLAAFSTNIGSASASKPFTVSGSQLTGDITLTSPAGFEISSDDVSFSTSLTLSPSAGEVPATTLHARVAASAPFGLVSGDLSLSSPDVASKTLPVSGTVLGLISTSPASLSGFSASQSVASASQSFTVNVSTLSPDSMDGSVTGLSPAITVSAPSGVQVSTNDVSFSSSVSLTDVPATLYARLAANAPVGAVSRNLTLYSTSFATATVPISGQVSAPVISATPAVITLSGLRGSASPARSITVNGSHLNAAVVATAPAGFEVSSDNASFGSTATLQPEAGSVSGTVQVRIAASSTVPLGQLTGDVTLSSNLATPVKVGLQGFVEAVLPAYGTVQTYTGTGTAGSTDGNSTTARFNGPWGISVDAQGNLYPIDYTGKRIRKVNAEAVASFLDSFTSFPPQYSAVDPATGHLYVSIETHRILRYVNKNAANYPAQTPVYGPETDFADSVIVYAGASTSGSTDGTGTAARFNNPRGLAVHDGHLYVADRGNNAIRKINLANAAVTTVALTQGNLNAPEGICADAAGVIYLTSTARDGVEKITPDGVSHFVAGAAGGGFTDGDANTARFNEPHGITLDARGNLLVADSGNHAIRRVSPAGDVVTVAGGSATGSYADGLGTAARFNSPRGLVFGPDGWLYVTDFNNHRIRRVNATQPQMVLSPDTLTPFTTDFGSASPSQTVEVEGSASAGLITITAPDGFELSTDGATYAGSVQVNSTASLQVRIAAGVPTGSVSGDLTFVSENAGTQSLALSGVVNIVFTASREQIFGIQARTGNASPSEIIILNGAGFTGPMDIAAPHGFEISTDGTNFFPSLRLGEPAGYIQTIYRGEFGKYTTASGAANWRGNGRETQNQNAFAALTSGGAVVTWGGSLQGGNSSSVANQLAGDVIEVFSNFDSFAALKRNGSVVTWGNTAGNSSLVAAKLASGVSTISSTAGAFAALKTDGSVVTWGSSLFGGDSSAVSAQLTSGVKDVYSSQRAFAALKTDGSVVTWGPADHGGDFSAVASQLSSGVTAIFSTERAFAALKADGSVITWGDGIRGGDSSSVSAYLTSDVQTIYATQGAFAALKNDGSVYSWGAQVSATGGAPHASNVAVVYCNALAFAAVRRDGSVVTWGTSSFGGTQTGVALKLTSGVKAVYSTDLAFAALKTDGSVVTWGGNGGDSSAVADQIASGVTAIYANNHAFAALKSDGSLITWGQSFSGGDSSSVAAQLASGVRFVAGNYYAFAALKDDGSVITWGNAENGGSGGPGNIGTPVNIPPSFPVTLHVRITATAPTGPVSGDITLASSGLETRTIAVNGAISEGQTHTHHEEWRFANFGSYLSEASGADNADPDGDGISNLMEYALDLNPKAPGVIPAKLVMNGGQLEYTYTRSAAAREGGLVYQIEWSETLEPGGWSVENVIQQIESTEGALETVKATIPAGTSGKRFLRVRVSAE